LHVCGNRFFADRQWGEVIEIDSWAAGLTGIPYQRGKAIAGVRALFGKDSDCHANLPAL
jgi:hypothetical protein